MDRNSSQPARGVPGDAERRDYQARRIEIARRRLAEWQGVQATLWEYRLSLRILVIRLQRPGERGNLHLVCADTESICAPTRWQPAALRLEPAAGLVLDPRVDTVYELSDPVAGALVRCGVVECKLDVAPLS